MAKPKRRLFSGSWVFWTLIALAVAPVGLMLAWSLVSEAIWWQEHKGMVVLSPALGLAKAVEEFRAKHGRYPETIEEYVSLEFTTASGNPYSWVDSLMEMSKRIGCPLTDVVIPTRTPQGGQTPLIVISGRSARVEIYPSERIGLSRCFRPRDAETPPEWLVVLPNEPWPGDDDPDNGY